MPLGRVAQQPFRAPMPHLQGYLITNGFTGAPLPPTIFNGAAV